jgi:hypothetical protein
MGAFKAVLGHTFRDGAVIGASQNVFGSFEGAETITVNMPSTGEPREQILFKDFDLQITAATATSSRLVATLKRCPAGATPAIELDNVTGLLSVVGVDSPVASEATLDRTSSSLVTLHIEADAFDHLSPGRYELDLTEITVGGRTILRHEVEIYFRRSAGREMA